MPEIGLYQHHYQDDKYPPSVRASDEAINVIREKMPQQEVQRNYQQVAITRLMRLHRRIDAIERAIDLLLTLASIKAP